jgi:hypothetical protein
VLIGNGRLTDKLPMSFMGRDGLNFLQPGVAVGSTRADSFGKLAAIPDGYYTPQAWLLPRKAGAIAARNLQLISIDTTGLAVGGVNADATTSITFTVADAAGQLISSGTGTASFTISALPLLLTASLNGIGATSFAFTTNAPLLGAEASAVGTANFTITGALVPYAIGSMSGSTVDSTVLTVDAIAAGILAAALTTPIHSDIRRVNGYEVTGNGQPGTEWGP